jgi:hypothetical protein
MNLENNMKLKPVMFVKGQYNYHRQNLLQQNLLLKALQITTDVQELKKMIGVRTVAEVYRTLDKIAIRKEYHEALLRKGIDLDTIVDGIKGICNDKEEMGAIRLKGWQMLLKSLGLDSYQDVTNESKVGWEDIVKKTSEEMEFSGGEQKKIISPDYEVIIPEVPEEEKRIQEEEDKIGKGLYE